MDKIIKNILKKIESEGYEAYIVGGFVRDKLLGKSSYDVDICTNALPKELMSIFKLYQNSNNYGGFNLKIKKYNIDITTYRKEIKYDSRKPIEIEYISNLFEDIKRRDFTINALCMDKNENVIDVLNAKKDLYDGKIVSLGDANQKFKEDPLRMLRAIRFATLLNFNIDEKTYRSICDNSKLVDTLSPERIKEELTKILSSKNYKIGLNLLKDTKIDSIMGLDYSDMVYTNDILGMYAQISSKKIIFTKNEKDAINKIKTIVNIGKIGNFELFKYGLYICLVSSDILGISRSEVNKCYKNMPIKCMKDIDISGEEIIKLLNIEPSKKVSEIINDVKIEILNNRLKNKKIEIKKYIDRKWKDE